MARYFVVKANLMYRSLKIRFMTNQAAARYDNVVH